MKNRIVAVLALVLLAFASVSMAAENLPQSEVDEIVKGVENGDNEAQFRLGLMYYMGQNVKQDYEQAAYWLKKSYEQGNVEAQFLLALMYVHGYGVEKDMARAFKLAKQVAEKKPSNIKNVHGFEYDGEKVYGSAEELVAAAQWYIGICYADGRGVQKNTEPAEFWLNKSLEHCSEFIKKEAQEYLKRIHAQKPKTSTASTQPKPQPSASSFSKPRNFDEAKGNADKFIGSVRDVAEKLMNTESYKTQDIENNGDESLYMRSWYNDRYFMFCYYANRPNPVASFRTYSPEFTFAGGIKVGTSFSEIRDLFGDFGSWSTTQDTFDISEGTGEVNIHITDGKIDYIEYNNLLAEYTHKMMMLLYLYRGNIYRAEITTDSRLNVRDAPDTQSKVLFQVLKDNNLLFIENSSGVIGNGGSKWYRVHLVYDDRDKSFSSVNEAYVFGKYISIMPLTYEERRALTSIF